MLKINAQRVRLNHTGSPESNQRFAAEFSARSGNFAAPPAETKQATLNSKIPEESRGMLGERKGSPCSIDSEVVSFAL
jgi:hypothetical protein